MKDLNMRTRIQRLLKTWILGLILEIENNAKSDWLKQKKNPTLRYSLNVDNSCENVGLEWC